MSDRNVSLNWVVGALHWIAGLVLVVADLGNLADSGDLGLWFTAAAAVITVRGFLLSMEGRERNAFELGRDFGRATPAD